MTCFLVIFSSVSIEPGFGQILYFMGAWTDHNYVIYENINLVQDLALYLLSKSKYRSAKIVNFSIF